MDEVNRMKRTEERICELAERTIQITEFQQLR